MHFDAFRDFGMFKVPGTCFFNKQKSAAPEASSKAFKIQYNTIQYNTIQYNIPNIPPHPTPSPPTHPMLGMVGAWGGVGGDIGDIVLYCIASFFFWGY